MSAFSKYPSPLTNKGAFNLLANIDLQQKNQWECIITRTFGGSALDIAKQVGGSIIDTLMARVFLYSITIPTDGFEYTKQDGNNYVTKAVYPEQVVMTFLVDKYGLSRRYVSDWMGEIASPYTISIKNNGSSFKYNSKIFADNQAKVKRNAQVLLTAEKGLPFHPRMTLKGLRPESVAEITIGHEESEKLLLELTLSVDILEIPVLI